MPSRLPAARGLRSASPGLAQALLGGAAALPGLRSPAPGGLSPSPGLSPRLSPLWLFSLKPLIFTRDFSAFPTSPLSTIQALLWEPGWGTHGIPDGCF